MAGADIQGQAHDRVTPKEPVNHELQVVIARAVKALEQDDPDSLEALGSDAPQSAYAEFIHALVPSLASYLDQQVSLESLTRMKNEVLHFCVERGWIERLVQALIAARDVESGESSLLEGLETTVQLYKALVDDAIEDNQEIIDDVGAFLAKAEGLSETDLMTSPFIGLSEDNKVRYQQGALTLGELLQTQPMLLVRVV